MLIWLIGAIALALSIVALPFLVNELTLNGKFPGWGRHVARVIVWIVAFVVIATQLAQQTSAPEPPNLWLVFGSGVFAALAIADFAFLLHRSREHHRKVGDRVKATPLPADLGNKVASFSGSRAVNPDSDVSLLPQPAPAASNTTTENVFTGTVKQMLAKATRAEDAYLLLQMLECRDYRTAGMGDRGQGILELPEVFVPLELDSSSIPAGFEQLAGLPDLERWQRELDIWYFLREAKVNRAYRQLAIIAWGGYGKTTLLRYLAYIFGTKQHEQYKVPFLIPMLLPLRQYRDALNAETSLDLAGLVQHQRLQQLQELDVDNKLARLPVTWAADVLRDGKALVMLDGFDEVPDTERPALSQWLHRQMQRFSES
ncbi:MAG: NACHT domain-containing protein, partial [Cyanobacteria bacterium P01_C01_bin.147]